MLAGSLEIELLTNMARLTTDMAQARQSVGTAMSAIEKSVAFAKAALVGLGAVGLAAAFANNVRAAIDLGDSLNKLTQRTGVSVEALSQLQYAAKMADVSTDSLTTGLKKLNVSIAAGASGDKEKIALFKSLGITVTDATGSIKKADTVLMEIADTFAKSKDGAGKTAIAVALLGKAGDEMIPLLNGGGTALRAMMVEADKLGLTIGTDFAAQAEEFNDNLARVQTSSQKLTVALAGDLVSGLGKAMKAMADATIEGGKLAGVMAFLQSLLTGDDRYKNDKAMVEQTEEKLRLENSLAKMEAQRNSGRVVNEAVLERQRAALEKANSALNTTIAYRKVLQGEDDATAAAAKRASDAQSKASELRLHNSSAEAAAALAAKEAAKQLADQQKLVLDLNGLSGSFTNDWNDLSAVYARGGLSLIQFTEAQAQLLAKQPAIKKASEDRTKLLLAEAEAAQQVAEDQESADAARFGAVTQGIQAVNDYAKAIDDSNGMLRLEQSLFGRSEKDRAIAIEQYRIELDLQKQLEAIKKNGGFNQADRDAAEISARNAAARAGAAAIERAGLDENVRVLQSIDSTAHDVFVNVFDNGSDAFKRLGQTLKASLLDVLYQMTIKKWIFNIGASVTGVGVAGQAAAAGATDGTGSSVIGAASNLSSIYSATSSMVTLGSQVVAGTMSVANALGTVAANATGTGISGLLAANGAYGTAAAGSASAMAGGATAALAAIPVWGWAALAAVAVASIFGGKGEKETVSTGIEGSFGAGGFSGNRFSNWKQDGGWFSSDGEGRDSSGLDATTAKQFTDAYAAVQTAAAKSAAMLGLSADAIAGYSENISVILTGDAAKDQEIVTKLFADLGNHMALAAAPGLAVYAKEGEGATATMDRLATSLVTANALLEVLGQRVFALSLAGGDAASKLADAFGGLDKLATATQQYYDLFFSDAEKLADTQNNMAKALAGVNLQLPTSKEGFRALAESLDLNTDAGRAAYATLLAIAPQFASTADAMAKTAAEAASKLFEGVTRNAVIDFEALARALNGVDVDTFAETVSLVFDNLAERIKSVLDSIATERGAVAQAMDQILNPATMSKAEIERSIAAINLNGPSNAGLVAAQRALQQADALVTTRAAMVAQAQALTPDRSGLDAAAGRVGTASAATAAAQAWVDRYTSDWGGKFAEWVGRALAGSFDNSVPGNSGEMNAQNTVRALRAAQEQEQAARDAYTATLAAYNAALATVQQPVADQQAALALATQAQAAAAGAARAAQLAYIASLQDFTIDAGKSVTKLGQLREETLKYYEAQKQLADLMGASAAGLRESIRVTRMGQLDSTQSLVQRQADFARAYTMALSTDGATKAGYADKLAAALPDLSTALADTASTRAEWVLATARLFAQSATIADQLEASAPNDYAAESLALLQTIDATLAALNASTMSAERIIAAAIDASSDRTAAGQRAIIAAITGQSIPAFAGGGLHAGGVRLVGENGPEWEATGPSRIYNSAQMRAVMGGGDSSGDALLEEVRGLRDETRAIAFNTGKTARILEKVTPGGTSVATHVEEV